MPVTYAITIPTLFAASVVGDIGRLIAQAIGAFALLLVAIWGQISLGNRALKMGQDMAFGTVAVMVWFIGMSQLIAGRVTGLALVIVTVLVGTALVDRVRNATWGRLLPIIKDDRMHMLGLVCLLFACGVFFLTSASVATPFGAPVDRAGVYDTAQARPNGDPGWQPFDSLPAPRKNMGATTVGQTLYIVGGEDPNGPTTSVLAFPTTATGQDARWTTRATLPEPRTRLAVASVGGKVYAFGGAINGEPTAFASVYDPAANTWSALPPFPEPRMDLAAAAVNGKIYLAGGTTNPAGTEKPQGSAVVNIFDPATGQWSVGAALPSPRSGLALAPVGATLYALGGQHNGTTLANVDVLDTATNTWRPASSLPEPRRNLAATSVNDARIYAIGGVAVAESTDTVRVLDVVTGRWTTAPSLVVGRSAVGTASLDGKIYELGGASDQLGQIVPVGGILFAVGEAIIVSLLAVAIVGVGIRRTQQLAVDKPKRVRQDEHALASAGRANPGGVIATSIPAETGPKMVGNVKFRWRRTPAEICDRLGIIAPTGMTLLVGVATAAILVGVTVGGGRLTAALSPSIAENVRRINDQTLANIGGLVAAAIAAVVLGIAEELLFRGATQPRFGIFLTALAYAALHTQYGFGIAPLTVFAVGLVLGVARRYANTTATIIANALWVLAMIALVANGVWTG